MKHTIKSTRTRTHEILQNLSIEDISFTIGRYCGKHNTILCLKKFGFVLDKQIAEDLLVQKILERDLIDH